MLDDLELVELDVVQTTSAGDKSYPIQGVGTYNGFAGCPIVVYYNPEASTNILSQHQVVKEASAAGYAVIGTLQSGSAHLISPDGEKYSFRMQESRRMVYVGASIAGDDDDDLNEFCREMHE